MPMKPPKIRHNPPRKAWNTSSKSRQSRGYGRRHELMRAQVLAEEPLCRACQAQGRVAATTIADHIIPKAEGGTDERENYQGLCGPCSKRKTAAEAKRGASRARAAPRW